MTSKVQKILPEKMTVTEKALGMSLFLAQLFPEDGAENGRTIDFVMQRYLMNFCIKIKMSKNTTQEMKTAIWRISAGLNIPLYPEFSKEQANEGRKPPKMNNICCSKDLITHVHVNNERAVNNRQVQKSDRINSDRQSGSDQLGSTRTNSDRKKK